MQRSMTSEVDRDPPLLRGDHRNQRSGGTASRALEKTSIIHTSLVNHAKHVYMDMCTLNSTYFKQHIPV